jgi:polypeptide N-acetylgalactosaminyltransferase
LSWHQDIRPQGREFCFDVPKHDEHSPVVLFACHGKFSSIYERFIMKMFSIDTSVGMRGNQHFAYDPTVHHIIHVSTRLCLDSDLESKTIFMSTCSKTSDTQRWLFMTYNETLIRKDMMKFL